MFSRGEVFQQRELRFVIWAFCIQVSVAILAQAPSSDQGAFSKALRATAMRGAAGKARRPAPAKAERPEVPETP
jgi:hypothetical protein